MSQLASFGFIGGGRITRLLLQALKQKNALPAQIRVAEPDDGMKAQLKTIDASSIQFVASAAEAVNVELLFLAVHPPAMKDVAAAISGRIGNNTIVISLIPVLSIEKLTSMLAGVSKLVRMIPNAASLIHQGYNPVAFSSAITSSEKLQLQELFAQWGESPEVDETRLEAYAIVTAMGPTYFWPQWVKLQALGKQFGLSDNELEKGMPAMLQGAVDLMYHSELPPEQVMDLIPVYPMKQQEPDILARMEQSLTGLNQKLTGATN